MPNTKLPTPLLHIKQESPLKLFRRRIAINPCREHICTMPTSLKSRAGSIIGCRCQLSPDPLYWILSCHRVQKSRQTMCGENREIVKKNQRRDDLILFSIFVAGHWVAGRKHFRVVKYFPHFENWPFVGSAWGWDGRQLCPMDRIKPTLWKMSPFGPGPTSHPATKPTHTSCELAKKDVKLESHMYSVYWVDFFSVTFKIVKKQNHHQTPFLVVNSLCLLGSINPVLFPAESPDYGKHSVGIPILCQSRHQIFFTTLK